MKLKFKIDIPTDIEKLTVDDIKFLSKDGKTELNFDDWIDEYLNNSEVIQKLKNIKKEMNNEY
ncbi:MAG: hypothetical protein HOB13_06395 [Lentimicrobiaceae bacterium]|jgi:hypothetical protein|nr:hypothetical protein [Lentimicrobiaceae bacterium]